MIPIVLSGGSGTRLWPLSRSQYPKQFCELMTQSLLGQTLRRLTPIAQPWVLTLADLSHLTRRVLSEQSLPSSKILTEPAARNTAPAIGLLCRIFELHEKQNELIGVFPADHLIEDESAFREAVEKAKLAATLGQIATLGIRPTAPATGFGYIECHGAGEVREVKSFREKPDVETARVYVESGRFFWNAGIFIFKLSSMIEAFRTCAPDIWEPLQELKADLSNLAEIYKRLPSISIDYAVMERVQGQVCIPCDMGWSDLGSWDDIATFAEAKHTSSQTASVRNQAEIINVKSENCFGLTTENKVVAFVELNDVLAIDTPDALLLMKRGSSQDVRDVVAQLAKKNHKSLREHQFEVRPWGRYEIQRDEEHYKLKKIVVDPKAQISYQSHALRSEHWVVVSGEGEVILSDLSTRVERGSYIFIPVGAKHRVRNTGLLPLEFIEVQIGSYFGEDDIVRYQDDYSRS